MIAFAAAADFASSVPGTLARATASGPCAGRFAKAAGSPLAGTCVHGPRRRSLVENQRPLPSVHQASPAFRRGVVQFTAHSTPSHAGESFGSPSSDTSTVGRVATTTSGSAGCCASAEGGFGASAPPGGGGALPTDATTSGGGAGHGA